MIAIKAGTLIDGTGTTPLSDAVILVDGEKIIQVGPAAAVAIPPDAEVIDASTKVVLPGMIDGHVHVQGQGGVIDRATSQLSQVTELTETTTLKSYVYAKAGPGGGLYHHRRHEFAELVGIALRDAINDGLVDGSAHAGLRAGTVHHGRAHGWYPLAPGGTIAGRTGVADSPWAFRQARGTRSRWAPTASRSTSAAAPTPTDTRLRQPFWQEMTFEEMEAVCEEAHKAYLRVFCHSSGGQGITDGILAGVDSLEHAHWITDGAGRPDGRARHVTMCRPSPWSSEAWRLRQAQGITGERGYLEKAIDVKYKSLETRAQGRRQDSAGNRCRVCGLSWRERPRAGGICGRWHDADGGHPGRHQRGRRPPRHGRPGGHDRSGQVSPIWWSSTATRCRTSASCRT